MHNCEFMIMNLDFVYPIGSIYLSVNSTNPSKWLGGTWTQITSDAYLKIVTSNAGSLGGTSSNHKIPISSIPSHRHSFTSARQYGTGSDTDNSAKLGRTQSNADGVSTYYTDYQGGGNAYYPYYYGVYVWKRTA